MYGKTMEPSLTRSVVLATTIVLGAAFAPTASAFATYDAEASVSLTLLSVLDSAGTASPDFLVEASGSVFDEGAFTTGVANAAFNNVVVDPPVLLAVNDSVAQSSSAFGNATLGTAESFSLTDFGLFVQNLSLDDLTFTFAYEFMVDAIVTGSLADGEVASAFAIVDILDDTGLVDFVLEASAGLRFGPLSDGDSGSGTFSFALAPGGENFIDGIIDADGFASSSVPAPATVALLGIGIAAIGAQRRRRRSA
jgi:hypothetical protein